jgi:DNA-directed RNA polymerase alpha subunit
MDKFPDDMRIEQFDLSRRTHNALVNGQNFQTIGEVRARADFELLQNPNCGRKSLKALHEVGIQ